MKILLAVDGSRASDAAVEAVLTKEHDAQVAVLCVLEPPDLLVSREMASVDVEITVAWEKEKQEAARLVQAVAEKLRSKGFKATPLVEQGDPKSRIVEAAKAWDADLVVLGSHGRKRTGHSAMGSVAEAVSHQAPCSVEIVRPESSS